MPSSTDPTAPAVASALVVGAGPAGLAAATSLRRHGVPRVDVVEVHPTREVLGSELSVASAMLRVLDRIGAAETVIDAGVGMDAASIFAPDGSVAMTVPFPTVSRPEFPAIVGISRSALHGALWEVAEQTGVEISLGTTIDAILDADAGTVRLSDGTEAQYDLVVGADGTHSRVRELIFPGAEGPHYTGQMVLRARVPRTTGPMLGVFNSPTTTAGMLTVDDESSYVFVLVNSAEPQRLPPEELPALFREKIAGFGGPMADIGEVEGAKEVIHFRPLMPYVHDGPWSVGRVVLIGDAAHTTTPHIAYGAGLAVEDGVILGERIAAGADAGADVASVLARFGAERAARCIPIVDYALEIQRCQLDRSQGGDEMGLMRDAQLAIAQPA